MTELLHEDRESVAEALEALAQAIDSRDGTRALEAIKTLDWEDQRRAVSRLSRDRAQNLIHILGAEDAAKLLSHLTEAQAVEIIEGLPAEEAAAILFELPTEESSNILRELHEDDAEEIIAGIVDPADRDRPASPDPPGPPRLHHDGPDRDRGRRGAPGLP